MGNPSLRWEQVNTFNLGFDFGSRNRRLSGSLEYYVKKASDLIGDDYMAPSTGINEANYNLKNKINYANITTKGWDVQLSSRNLIGELNWTTDVLFSYTTNEVTNINTAELIIFSTICRVHLPMLVAQEMFFIPCLGMD